MPKDAYSTVSAFSNSGGGHLVFGIQHDNGKHTIVGVVEVDKVQNDFLSVLRAGDKISKVISAKEEIVKDGDITLLVFYIPEARRQDKPIYLQGDIRKSFIRKAGDEKCRKEEIEAFLRDASTHATIAKLSMQIQRHSSTPIRCDGIGGSSRQRNPGNESSGQTDTEFLHEWGLLLEDGDA